MTIIIFLIILGVLILVHEFGHFIVAKKSGIRVDEFGLGFPPKIFSKKYGGTLYTLNALPFGGFVKIFGEDPHSETISEEQKSTSFFYKSKWIQSAVLSAGVFMNVVFAWLLLSLGFMIGLPSSPDYSSFGKVSNVETVITQVLPNSPAESAGLRSGDVLFSITSSEGSVSGESITPESVKKIISESKNDIEIVYKRGSTESSVLSISPEVNSESKQKMIGVAMEQMGFLKLPPHLAALEGARTTGLLVKETFFGLMSFFGDAFRLKSDLSNVTGPVGIAGVVGEASELGFIYLLSLVSIISINLAIINLLPFPALDGGRLFFILIEVITRRKIPDSFARIANFTGFIILLILMLVVTVNDVFKLL